MEYKTYADRAKPTLLKAYYKYGPGIDFKTDGTYIFDDYETGFSNYIYGDYNINGNEILLDEKQLNYVVFTDSLEIREIEIKDGNKIVKQKYIAEIGHPTRDEIQFTVTEDNRK